MTARNEISVIIASGTTASTIADGKGQIVAGVYLPPSFTGTALTFIANRTSGLGGLVSDGAGSSYTRTVRANDYVPLPRDVFSGVDRLQVISGSSEAADRTLVVVFVP